MIVRWRRSLHVTSNRALGTLKTLKVESPEKFQFNLSPEAIESTVSNCPSDKIALSFFLWCARQPNYFHVPRSFDQMVPIVSRLTDRLGTVSGIVYELESVGCFRKAQTFLLLLRIYWRGNMHRLVLEAFDEMGSHKYVPNTFARNMVLDVLFKIGHIDKALRFLTDTQFPNFLTLNIAIHNLCKLNDWRRVQDALRVMVKRGFCPDVHTFLLVLVCLQKAGRLVESLQLVGFMIVSGKHPMVAVWSSLIEGYCRIGRVDLAGELYWKMVDSGCSPTVVTYTSLIKAFLEVRMFDKAFCLLDAMLSDGCKPDLVFYNVLIDFLCKSRRYDDAIDLFLCMRERNIRPDSYTLSSLTSILCSPGKIRLFPNLIGELDGSVDLAACNSLLNVFGKAGFPSQAVEFYNDMIDRGFTPDSFSYVGLLNGLFRSGRVDDAINVYRGILLSNTIVDGYVHSVVFSGLIKEGKIHRAITLFRNAVSANYCIDVVSYTIAIHGLFKGGRFEEACNLFSQMKQSGLVPNICTYNVMLCGFCDARDVDAVKQLLRDMLEAGIELDCISFNIIIGLLIKLRRVHSAFHVIKEMCDVGLKPNRATHSLLLNGLYCAHTEEVEDLYPVLKYYSEDGIFMDSAGSDPSDNPQLCSGIIDILFRLSWNRSVDTLESREAVGNCY